MAVKGSSNELLRGVPNRDDEMKILLDNEIASIYIPADKSTNAIFKVKHRANREFQLTQTDASKEFVLTVVELVCGSSIYHEEGLRKSFNI